MASVCIVVEHFQGRLKKATLNAITFGMKAAKLIESELILLVIGKDVSDIANEVSVFGADKIYIAEDPLLEHYTAETWGHVVAEAAKACDAKIIGMSSGTTGKDLMPRVAAKLNAGMASEILDFDGQNFMREMWAGSALCEVEVVTEIKVVSIQTTAFEPITASNSKTLIEPLKVMLPEVKTRFIEMHEIKSERPELTDARIIITGGRGMKASENFKLIEQTADILGAAIGGTRAAVDAGWVTNDQQIGQTGKKVAPELYIAVGLSGSVQHLAGIKSSKVIVAININEDAPIFQVADYGLVADLFNVLPEFTEKLKDYFK